jgi:tRNA A-37 threonylcarbamoyl transferase component Bud32
LGQIARLSERPISSRDACVTARPDLQALGLTSADAFLDLQGEIVSGHPDRHVMRVELPDGRVCFLKKEHRVRWKDRFENWRAGLGWCSKSVREGRMLSEMEVRRIGTPSCLAFGEDGRGRAFVLIAAVPDAVDLRRFVHLQADGEELAIALGRFCAELHAARIDHPDLYAKHFLIEPTTFELTLLDWQRAIAGRAVSWSRRIHALAALAATLPSAVSAALRTHMLWAYLRRIDALEKCGSIPSFASLAKAIGKRVRHLEGRRGIREQRQPPLDSHAQRLVWVDGEALCALPEIADELRPRAARLKLFDLARDQSEWTLAYGRQAWLHVGGHRGWLRRHSWRAPEVRLARLLFHLERYRLAAPKLLAYGQRRREGAIESFVLHEKQAANTQPLSAAIFEANPFRCDWLLECLAGMLNRLHESGCAARTIECFGMDGDTIVIPDPRRLLFRRRLSSRQKAADRTHVIRSMETYCGREDLARFAKLLEGDSKR